MWCYRSYLKRLSLLPVDIRGIFRMGLAKVLAVRCGLKVGGTCSADRPPFDSKFETGVNHE